VPESDTPISNSPTRSRNRPYGHTFLQPALRCLAQMGFSRSRAPRFALDAAPSSLPAIPRGLNASDLSSAPPSPSGWRPLVQALNSRTTPPFHAEPALAEDAACRHRNQGCLDPPRARCRQQSRRLAQDKTLVRGPARMRVCLHWQTINTRKRVARNRSPPDRARRSASARLFNRSRP